MLPSQSCRLPAKSQCIPCRYLLMITSQSCPPSHNISFVDTFTASLSITGPFRHFVCANSTIKRRPQVTMYSTPQISPLPRASHVAALLTKPPSCPCVIISKRILLDSFAAIDVSSCIVPLDVRHRHLPDQGSLILELR